MVKLVNTEDLKSSGYGLVGSNPTSGTNLNTECSAVGSAPALGAGCREFESPHSDHFNNR